VVRAQGGLVRRGFVGRGSLLESTLWLPRWEAHGDKIQVLSFLCKLGDELVVFVSVCAI